MTTTKIYSREELEALNLTHLRKVFVQTTGLGPGTRRRETLVESTLEHQAEANPGDDDQERGDSSQESTEQEPEPEPEVTEPIKVKVNGTGDNTGSTLLCDLVSTTGTIVVVKVLGKEVRFRIQDGQSVRARKSWASAGWLLDVATLPEMKELSVEQLSEQKPADLSLAQLRDLYLGLSGRSTTSESRTYLTQRVRLAREGRLPAGTRRTRSGEPTKVLPVSMPVSTVEALDEAWRRLGFPSRIAFIRRAISEKLQAEGEDEVAEMIGK